MRADKKLRADPAFSEPRHRCKSLECCHDLFLRVQWQSRLMRTVTVTRGVVSIFFHQVRGIRKQQCAEFLSGGISEDRPAKAVTHHPWEIAGVIQMRVRERDKVDRGGILRTALPIA